MAEVTTDPADAPIKLRLVTTDTAREGVGSDQDADELRGALVDQIIARHGLLGLVLPGEVEAVLRTVPRHLFAPGVPLEKAYANDSITKSNERGVNVSAVSAPWLQAMMLAQAQLGPGMRRGEHSESNLPGSWVLTHARVVPMMSRVG